MMKGVEQQARERVVFDWKQFGPSGTAHFDSKQGGVAGKEKHGGIQGAFGSSMPEALQAPSMPETHRRELPKGVLMSNTNPKVERA